MSRRQEALAKRFGELVRRLRSEQGYSQEQFSFRVGVDRTYINQIEQGRRNVTLGTADRLARGLGLTLAGLLLEMEQDADDPEGEQSNN